MVREVDEAEGGSLRSEGGESANDSRIGGGRPADRGPEPNIKGPSKLFCSARTQADDAPFLKEGRLPLDILRLFGDHVSDQTHVS